MTTSSEMTGLAHLTRTVRGEVLTPTDGGYAARRTGYQLLVEHRPDVIVVAEAPTDVQAAVRFATENGFDVAVRGTGHGTPNGQTGGVLVVTEGLDELSVDADRHTARIGAGVRWTRVLSKAADHGLCGLPGSAPEVSAVGYLLGGGVSVLGRAFGYAADYVRSLEVVTADGALREVDPTSEPDLFWALCGGGAGAYGVVTAVEIELLPLESVYGGGLFVAPEDIPAVLRAWRDWTRTVPDTVTSAVALVPFPDVEELPPFLRGRHVAHLWITAIESEDDAVRLVAPLRDAVPILADTLQVRRTDALAGITDEPTDPAPFTIRGTTLDRLDDDAIDALLRHAGPGAPGAGIVEIRHLGGAMSRPQKSPNAVGHRDAAYSLGVLSVLHGTATVADAEAWQAATMDALSRWVSGRALLNLMGGAAVTPEGARLAFEEHTFRRLCAVKSTYDPRNVFCRGVAIPAAER